MITKIIGSFAGLFLLLSPSAWAHSPDISCDGGNFTITRTDGFQGDLFLWKFSGHINEHFQGNKIFSTFTRARVSAEGFNHMFFENGTAGINAGPSFDNKTQTAMVLINGQVSYVITFTKDSQSSGYFIRALLNTSPPRQQIAEYYLRSCIFGPRYSPKSGS